MRAAPLCLFISILVPAAFAQNPALPPDFDKTVERSIDVFHVPGLCVAIVKDGKVVLVKGYGVKRLGHPEKVDSRTLFGIASNTKAFTATALATMVDEGKLSWDDRVIQHLPAFKLSDPYVTREMRINDLLCHRSGLGLGAGDLLWWPESNYTAKEILDRLQYIPLATSFRAAYAYDNVLYLGAGAVLESVDGAPWAEVVEKRILKKVGMNSSTTTYAGALKSGRLAATHAEVEGKLKEVRSFTSEITGPAGGIYSCADDMAKWLQVQLGRGAMPDGSRLFSEKRSSELWNILTPIPVGPPPPGLEEMASHFSGYASGFGVSDYRGQRLIAHTGGLPGYVSIVAMLPEKNAGVVVLTNQESGAAFTAIANAVLDHYCEAKPVDWVAKMENLNKLMALGMKMSKPAEAKRNKNSRPSLPMKDYAGPYVDLWYGEVSLKTEGDKLVMRFSHTPALVGELEHWQYDTFVVRWRDRDLRADAFVTFSLNPDGSIDEVKMAPFSPDVDFSFDFEDLRLKPVKK